MGRLQGGGEGGGQRGGGEGRGVGGGGGGGEGGGEGPADGTRRCLAAGLDGWGCKGSKGTLPERSPSGNWGSIVCDCRGSQVEVRVPPARGGPHWPRPPCRWITARDSHRTSSPITVCAGHSGETRHPTLVRSQRTLVRSRSTLVRSNLTMQGYVFSNYFRTPQSFPKLPNLGDFFAQK